MNIDDKNIHFLLTKVRELEEKIKHQELINTYNGVNIKYVDDETLQYLLKTTLPDHNMMDFGIYIYNELLARERHGIKIIKG